VDFYLWAEVAIVVQLNAYGLVQLVFPKRSDWIVSGELPAATWLAGASIAAELLRTAAAERVLGSESNMNLCAETDDQGRTIDGAYA
jgi:hypothetical protein